VGSCPAPEWLGPGGYAYLIGFIDDHSRYITALEGFRSQTADNLMEVFRRGVGAYGAPKEMLTDNGRQYASWHGKPSFSRNWHGTGSNISAVDRTIRKRLGR